MNRNVEKIMKTSLLYGFVMTQPFVNYVDAYPELQNKILFKSDQLEIDEHGESVRLLQKKLHTLSYFDQPVDGMFGYYTKHAIKNFQANHKLSINGNAKKETLTAIVKNEQKQYKQQLKTFAKEIQPGMHNEKVKLVQKSLQYFGYYEGELDGIYGPLTKQALEIAENKHDLKLIIDPPPTPTEKQPTLSATNKEPNTEPKEKTKQKAVQKPSYTGINGSGIVEKARSQMGTPYVWGGTSPGGFDCSGFIQYVFQQEGITIPRTVSEIYNFSQPISEPSVGDLVFFETYKPGPSHMGIYVGNGSFIHAGESRGVEVSKMNNSYWQERYLGATRVKQ
ncbi:MULTISPECIES: NlpC/P60 family protein [Virgibacillus]|uniref:NlpC/P60 family protein n=1 Tax=Virgibacillus dokdonensis TaxID=302167 RepID=A0A2K9J3D0_9BACI|nr:MULTISPECIES: NlpC/P60 family protein [Virgibacillus]AUJ26458.1 putative peptidoglycan endopeptidase LytE precursor [Virgibacillus dokdonensis]NWO14846.1 C40 family peptidase [Virgibacillus sp.]